MELEHIQGLVHLRRKQYRAGSNVCGDVGREVIWLTHSQGNLIRGQGPYLLLTAYTHGVPHMDCEGPCAVTRTNPLLPVAEGMQDMGLSLRSPASRPH
jgi:hypothetical protein